MRHLCVSLLAAFAGSVVLATPPAPARGRLTIEALIDIKHPSQAAWSPDGEQVAFVWDRAGVQDVYVAGSGQGEPHALTAHASGLVAGLFWSGDSRSIYFERDGDLWRVPSTGSEPAQRVWTTPDDDAVRDGLRAVHRSMWRKCLARAARALSDVSAGRGGASASRGDEPDRRGVPELRQLRQQNPPVELIARPVRHPDGRQRDGSELKAAGDRGAIQSPASGVWGLPFQERSPNRNATSPR